MGCMFPHRHRKDRWPIRPARLWYWLAGAAVVAAVVWSALGLVLGFRSLSRQVEEFQRVPIPGQAEVSLAGAVLAAVVAVRRNRARRMLPAAAAQPAGSWGQGSVAAGWFADPGGRHELRYWDGQRWTGHVSDHGTQGVDAM
jgi:hypothetical protein